MIEERGIKRKTGRRIAKRFQRTNERRKKDVDRRAESKVEKNEGKRERKFEFNENATRLLLKSKYTTRFKQSVDILLELHPQNEKLQTNPHSLLFFLFKTNTCGYRKN